LLPLFQWVDGMWSDFVLRSINLPNYRSAWSSQTSIVNGIRLLELIKVESTLLIFFWCIIRQGGSTWIGWVSFFVFLGLYNFSLFLIIYMSNWQMIRVGYQLFGTIVMKVWTCLEMTLMMWMLLEKNILEIVYLEKLSILSIKISYFHFGHSKDTQVWSKTNMWNFLNALW